VQKQAARKGTLRLTPRAATTFLSATHRSSGSEKVEGGPPGSGLDSVVEKPTPMQKSKIRSEKRTTKGKIVRAGTEKFQSPQQCKRTRFVEMRRDEADIHNKIPVIRQAGYRRPSKERRQSEKSEQPRRQVQEGSRPDSNLRKKLSRTG